MKMQPSEFFIIAIWALSSVIVSMAVYIISVHKKQVKEQKEWHAELKEIHKKTLDEGALNRTAVENNTKATENNTKVFDRVFDFIGKATK